VALFLFCYVRYFLYSPQDRVICYHFANS